MSRPTARPTLVLIHGLFSSPMEFALLTRLLHARGIAHDGLEIPGYTSPARRTASTWRDWIDAAEAALDARYGPDVPLVLGGLCVGGMVAAEVARRPRRQRIAGLVLLSPTFAYDGWAIGFWHRWRRLAYVLRIDRWITVREKEPFGIKNAKTRQWVLQQLAQGGASAIGPATLPLRAIRETEALYAFVASRFADLDVPILAMHAREDEIASVASVERVLDRASVHTRLVVLEDSFHMITIDNDRRRVAHALADFVDASHARPQPDRGVRSAAVVRPHLDAPRSVRLDSLLPDLWMPT